MLLPDTKHQLGNQPLIATRSLKNVTKIASRQLRSSRAINHIVMGKNGGGKSVIASHIQSLARQRGYVGNTTGVVGIQLISPVTPFQFGIVLLEALGVSLQKINRNGDPETSLLTTLKNLLTGNDTKLIIIDQAQYLSDDAIEYMIELCSQAACSTLLFGPPQMKKRLKSSPIAWSHFQWEITRITKFKMDEFLDTILSQLKIPLWIYNNNSNDDRELGKYLYNNTNSFRDLVIILNRASAHAIANDDEKIALTHIDLAFSNKRANVYKKAKSQEQPTQTDSPEKAEPILNRKKIVRTRASSQITKIASDLFRSDIRPQFHDVTGISGSGKTTIIDDITSLAIPRSYAGNTTGVVNIYLSNPLTTIQFAIEILNQLGKSPKKIDHFDRRRSLFKSLYKTLTSIDTKLIIIDNAHHLSVGALDYLIVLCESCKCNALLFGLDRLENLLRKSHTAFSYFQRETTKIEWFDENEFLNNILPQINIPLWEYKNNSEYDRKMGSELYKKVGSFRDLITIIERASDHAAQKNKKRILKAHIKNAFENTRVKNVPETIPQKPKSLPPGYSEIEEKSDRRRAARLPRRSRVRQTV